MQYVILIPSCDKFADLWPMFFGQLFRYWPDVPPVYLITNHRDYDDARVQVIKVGDDKSWADNLAAALPHLPCDHLLLMLEDFPLMGKVDQDRLQQYFQTMVQEHAGYLRLRASPDPDRPHSQVAGLGYIQPGASYRTSLQAAFWYRPTLQAVLKSGENPWQFELLGSRRSDACSEPFLSVDQTLPPPIPYFPNAVIRGVWAREAVEALEHQGVAIARQARAVESGFDQWWRRWEFRRWLARALFIPIKRRLGIPTP